MSVNFLVSIFEPGVASNSASGGCHQWVVVPQELFPLVFCIEDGPNFASGGCNQWGVVPQEVHSEEVGGLQDQAVAAKEMATAEQIALQASLADGKAREEGLADQIAELQSVVASLEASLGERYNALTGRIVGSHIGNG